MKHEGCGGELKKYGKHGRYSCALCHKVIKVGEITRRPLYQKNRRKDFDKL